MVDPIIPDSFIRNHLKGKIQSTKLKLTSDATNRAWEVELDGQRFADGWKNFSVHHCVRNDDVLSFRHDGDMVFHVTPFGRRFSHQIQSISSTSDDENDDLDDDDDDHHHNADVGDDDDVWTSEEEDIHPKRTSTKKRARTVTESSSDESYFVAHVTASNLTRNHLGLVSKFASSNGLKGRQCEIDLINEDGKSWNLDLRHNKTTGQAYISGRWNLFCKENEIKAGSSCRFKFVQTGTKPALQLCPSQGSSSKSNRKRNDPESEGDDEIETDQDPSETGLTNQNKILTFELKPHMLRTGQLRLPALFTRENGIKEAGEITVVNNDGVEWKLHLVNIKGRGQFYIRSMKGCFLANGVKKVGDSFKLELIRGGTSPILKICSQIKEAGTPVVGYKTPETSVRQTIQALRAEEGTETRVQKRGRVSAEGGGGSCPRTKPSNDTVANQGNLPGKQPIQPCSISDQVTKVKECIVETLTDVRRFRSELKIKEHNLEASLLEIDALGMI
ncbi:unnamed protein product [Microthlaspi erraticum]|uniref:TF-B3 domain-containing protein n=1 Tax=Microthlaspi erraticum TaxID=1685480 RepID=A0A6D2HKZ8_9BRAS|nr:unnamed protein product [Microthlaspi erraticum]